MESFRPLPRAHTITKSVIWATSDKCDKKWIVTILLWLWWWYDYDNIVIIIKISLRGSCVLSKPAPINNKNAGAWSLRGESATSAWLGDVTQERWRQTDRRTLSALKAPRLRESVQEINSYCETRVFITANEKPRQEVLHCNAAHILATYVFLYDVAVCHPPRGIPILWNSFFFVYRTFNSSQSKSNNVTSIIIGSITRKIRGWSHNK
jgi:hypothetical protein